MINRRLYCLATLCIWCFGGCTTLGLGKRALSAETQECEQDFWSSSYDELFPFGGYRGELKYMKYIYRKPYSTESLLVCGYFFDAITSREKRKIQKFKDGIIASRTTGSFSEVFVVNSESYIANKGQEVLEDGDEVAVTINIIDYTQLNFRDLFSSNISTEKILQNTGEVEKDYFSRKCKATELTITINKVGVKKFSRQLNCLHAFE